MNRLARRLGTIVTTAVLAAPLLALPASQADASGVRITSQSFGMTWLNPAHPYPTMPFGTARIWDMGLTWRDLQPNAPTVDLLGNVTSDGWDQNKLTQLDNVVKAFNYHGVQPVITLGQTPDWDADTDPTHCNTAYQTYGVGTCAPKETDATSPWAKYVAALATRYNGSRGSLLRVSYFETWNESDLQNGYNGPEATMALLQQTAQQALHSVGAGQALLSPSVPLHDGSHGIDYLKRFINYQGGTSFDIVNLHLYSSIATAKAGYGPEWTMGQLAAARSVLAAKGLGGRQVWNTEVNVGNQGYKVTFTGLAGAAQIARTYILNIENHVSRTIWYAADVRTWAGTVLVNSDYKTLTYAGVAERTLRNLVVNGTANGCSRRTMAANKWRYTCKFHLANGRNMLALWTTGAKYYYNPPTGTKGYYTVTGARHYASHATRFTITGTPVYIYGTFKI